MGKKQAVPVSAYCEMCEREGYKRVHEAVINGHRVCGFHMCCLDHGEEAAWPIVSRWANCKWVKEFQSLLRPLLDPFPVDEDRLIQAVCDYGVKMKLDPQRLRRLERRKIAGRWVERRETGAEYASRVNAYLERFIADEAVKIAKEQKARKESNDENV